MGVRWSVAGCINQKYTTSQFGWGLDELFNKKTSTIRARVAVAVLEEGVRAVYIIIYLFIYFI